LTRNGHQPFGSLPVARQVAAGRRFALCAQKAATKANPCQF
jgi:hypothetical protein